MKTNRRTEANTRKDLAGVPNRAQMATAISEALQIPFPIWGSGDIPQPLVCSDGDEGDWTVFANHHPRKSGAAITRALRRKLLASHKGDEAAYFDGQFVTTFDLTAKSGKWPDSSVEPDPGYDETASVRHRLVLYHNDKPIGFCTVGMALRSGNGTTGVELGLNVFAVFVEPKHRGRGLSELLAEGVGALTVDLVEQFASRLGRYWTGGSCPIEIVFEGEAISEGGVRFGDCVEWQLEGQLGLAGLDDSSVVHLKNIVRPRCQNWG
ncbi:GNAT family N-acetyltransferase [Paraburkholderia ferrariae]|uniref:GNAT family N-acetyltransferase n=1 Tax=Paraburkholderia ferrariae TaxID=386056 RepID=A0ABU9S4H8_9BURK